MFKRVALWMLFAPAAASAQDKEPEKNAAPEPEVRHIVLTPSAAPKPALKYPLLPEVRDQKSGNAAIVYLRANTPEWVNPQFRDQAFGKIDWFAGPLSGFPKADAERVEKQCTAILKEIDLAARRSTCTWELTERMRTEGAWLLLPEVQGLRQFGVLQGMRARRALADGKYDDAIYAMQSGFALSQHVAEPPILINCLVGAAIANMMTVPLEDWVQSPGSPNLYWSLTDLPSPIIPLRRAFQGEKLIVENIFPGAREALADPKVKFVAPANAAATLSALGGAKIPGQAADTDSVLGEMWLTLKLQKEAREYLKQRGRSEAQLNALDGRSIVALYLVAQYDIVYDDLVKWTNRPFWQGYPGMQRSFEDFKQNLAKRREAMILPSLLVPALNSVTVSQARLERKIALLRSFEAIRFHAAGQNPAKLPQRWADLGDIPVPIDPATGHPFDFRVENGQGILSVPALPGNAGGAVVYQITLGK